MKNTVFYITAVAVLAAALTACTAEVTKLPMNVALSQTTATLEPGGKLILTSVVTPDEALLKNLTWSSSDPSVAVVDNGTVTALNEGTAIITATTSSGNKSAHCKLLVAYPISSVQIERVPALLTVSRQLVLTAIVLPVDAPNKNVTWVSSDPGIAEVDQGVVTAKSPGTATITVTTDVGARTAKFTVRFVPENYVWISITMPFTKYFPFSVAGNGEVEIDWGDISDIESTAISPAPSTFLYHNYSSGTLPLTVTIAGEHISNLNCTAAQITNLDVSNCATLEILYCYNNQLRNLDLKNNPALTELNCFANQLTSLDVSNNTALKTLNCSQNQFSAEAFNVLFNTLHDHIFDEEQKLIYILNNPGTNACQTSIASAKGWTVR